VRTPLQAPSPAGMFSWAMYDWANSAVATVIQTFVFAAYFTRQVAVDETTGSAQWGNMVGLVGLLVALGGPILGAIADRSGSRKPWLAVFTLGCVGSTALLWFVRPDPAWVLPALLLAAASQLTFEYATIFYNAMLPGLTSPERLGRWSGWAWGLGYAGGLACLLAALLLFVEGNAASWMGLDRRSAEPVRATFLLAAAWYLVFAAPLFAFTPDAPASGKGLADSIREGIRQIQDSFKNVRPHAHIIRFLVARMIYSDGLATVFAFGGVYAAGTFDMTEGQVILFGIWLNVTAGAGAAVFAWVDDLIGSKRTILLALAGLVITSTGLLVVTSSTLFWAFGLALGVFVGPVQAASRSYLARVAPPELHTQMFGLFAFSGKATSFAGPLLVGWITYCTGSQRIGMGTVIFFFVLGAALMLTVPSARRG